MLLLLLSSAVLAGAKLDSLAARAGKCGVDDAVIAGVMRHAQEGAPAGQAAQSILDILIRSCEAGLPQAPFAGKVSEGLAKRVPLQRIVPILETRFKDYSFVRELLVREGTDSSGLQQDTAILGDALASGMTRQELEILFARLHRENPMDAVLGVQLYSYMFLAGLGKDACERVVAAGLEHDALNPDWLGFSRVVVLAKRKGLEDEAIARAAVQALSEKADVKRAMMLLGFTARPVLNSDE